MRRLWVTVMLVGVFQVVAPQPALAIWGFLDRLSGPGKFDGPQVEFRLVCFSPEEKGVGIASLGIESGCPLDTSGKKPRASINLGLRFFKAEANSQYAGNKEIRLTTLVPSFSWSVLAANDKADFLDVGVGAGVYWFSSEGFKSFRGAILEPVRFDVHVAPGWVKDGWGGALAQVVTFRLGWVIFPSGFEADVFSATGDKAVRIPSEAVLAKSVFLDLAPLIRLVK